MRVSDRHGDVCTDVVFLLHVFSISVIARHSLSGSVIPRGPAALKSTEIKHERLEDLASRRVAISPIVNHWSGLRSHELLSRNAMFLER